MDKWHNIKECGKFLLKSHLSFLLMCMVIRITKIITCSHLMLEESKNDFAKIAEGVLRGTVFDNSVSAMFLLLPVLALGLFCTFGIIKKSILKVFAILIGILYALSVAISVGNIPYITYKMANVCLADLSYLSKPGEMIGMMTGEPLYLAFFIAGWIPYRRHNIHNPKVRKSDGYNRRQVIVLFLEKSDSYASGLRFLLFDGTRQQSANKKGEWSHFRQTVDIHFRNIL